MASRSAGSTATRWSAPRWCSTASCPKLKRYLAYLPEGPDIDWLGGDLGDWLTPMAAHLKKQGAFGIRMGPPVVMRRWYAATIKAGHRRPGAHDAVARAGRRQ